MYSIAKLLSDEPKKLESIILAVLKLLITIWFAQIFLDFKTNLNNFSVESFFKNFRVDESIYFILTSIGIWYILWELIMDLLMELILKLLSILGNPEALLKWYLVFTNSVKTKNDYIIDSKRNLLYFTESILDKNEKYPFLVETRANQIFSIGLVSYLIMINSDIKLNNWQIALCLFLLLNFLIVSVIQYKLHDYYVKNCDFVREKYYPLGQCQKIKDAISQIENLKSNFNMEVKRKRIVLTKHQVIDFLPQEINFLPIFFYNKGLGEKNFQNLENIISKITDEKKVNIICSNFYNSENRVTEINKTTFSINGDSTEDIYQGIEEVLFLVQKNMDQIDENL